MCGVGVKFIIMGSNKDIFCGDFLSSLKFLSITSRCVVLVSNVLTQCNFKLELCGVDVGELLDLSNCSSFDSVNLYFLQELLIVLVLCTSNASKLKSLGIRWNPSTPMALFINILDFIQRLDQVVGLERLHIHGYSLEGWTSLLTLTKLQSLKLDGHGGLLELCILHQVQELYYKVKGSIEVLFLNGFEQLQILDLFGSYDFIHLFGMGDLPALRSFDLNYCECLQWLLDLSKLKSLEELNFDYYYALKLHEEDIQMLAALPLLHLVCFSEAKGTIKLDFVRWKVLKRIRSSYFGGCHYSRQAWREGEQEEEELGQPPIGILKSY